ncbi:unnamed protein product [Ectocarpus sp. 8 AP-2014]
MHAPMKVFVRLLQEYRYDTMLTSGSVLAESQGAPEIREALEEGLRLQWSFGFPYTPKELPVLTNAFFPYPAGMQPATAHHLLETVLTGRSVLDPFVGGGTVIVEALRAGRLGVGSDVSPLSLFVSRGRTWIASDSELEELREAVRSVCEASAAKLGETHTRQVSGKDWDCIESEIADYLARSKDGVKDELRDALWFVLAVARPKAATKRRRGVEHVVACEVFHSVCKEYTIAVKNLTSAATAGAAPCLPQTPVILRRDARHPLPLVVDVGVGGKENAGGGGLANLAACFEPKAPVGGDEHNSNSLVVDAVLTSPPYPGVYDYLAHARQVRSVMGRLGSTKESRSTHRTSIFSNSRVPTGRNWADEWVIGEIGSKRKIRRDRKREAYSGGSGDGSTRREDNWENDQKDWILATTNALRVGGRIGIMLGDGDGVDTRSSLLRTVEVLRTQEGAVLDVLGWATFRSAAGARRRMRTEHIILLEKL